MARQICRSALALPLPIGQSGAVTDPPPRRPQLRIAGVSESVEGFDWRDFTCPGCGCAVRVRSTPNVTIEWEGLPDGRYIGFVVRPAGLLNNFAFEVECETDSGIMP